MSEILQVNDLVKTFSRGKQRLLALNGISFSASAGKITGLIGPDGAGKTTLMRIIAGLMLPDRGSVQVDGLNVLDNPLKVQATIAYMPQRFGLYEDLTVRENLNLYADLKSIPKTDRIGLFDQILRSTGLLQFSGRLARKLSGGMKQKLGLACTMISPPSLLLLDEPTIGVDPQSRRELWKIIQDRVSNIGMSVLMTTAYLDEAEQCSEVILLHQGSVLGQGQPQSMITSLTDRTWYVRPDDNLSRRSLLALLKEDPTVEDATIYHDGVRVLLYEPLLPEKAQGTTWTPLPPSFENAYINYLHQAQIKNPTHPKSLKKESNKIARVSDWGKTTISKNIIHVKEVSKKFGNFLAVNNISFDVRQGEIFGLLGANGAGKSTTFRMLCGLLPPTHGVLTVNGVDLRRAAATARARIGYMAQKFALYGQLTVHQNLIFFANIYGLKNSKRQTRIEWAIKEFSFSEHLDTNAHDLPLGFKQRLALACALMHEPDILFLDEPTSGVDPVERREFWNKINSMAENGVTIMVTTHFLEEAEYCDRLVIMSQGEILVNNTPSYIRAYAKNENNDDPSLEDAFLKLIQDSSKTKNINI